MSGDLCKCGHAFSVHTRDIHDDGRSMRVDEALLPPKRYDINTDGAAGESGCTLCSCLHWERAQ